MSNVIFVLAASRQQFDDFVTSEKLGHQDYRCGLMRYVESAADYRGVANAHAIHLPGAEHNPAYTANSYTANFYAGLMPSLDVESCLMLSQYVPWVTPETNEDLRLEWARVRKMCEGTTLNPWRCFLFLECPMLGVPEDTPRMFNSAMHPPKDFLFARRIINGKPVFTRADGTPIIVKGWKC